MIKKNLLVFFVLFLLITGFNGIAYSQDSHPENHNNHTTVVENNHNGQDAGHATEHEGGHDDALLPLFFIIVSLLIGAAVRHFFRKIPLPFTVLLLIIGIGLGLLNRFGLYEGWGETFGESLRWAGHINPHAMLFIFLPILIFEAAFAMDVHTFKKTAANSIILAVPGIILALVMSAGLALLIKYFDIGLYGWEWNIALMFGAVISATDPVAVVALLKELGASKKLGTLIEGESLLNDGTAIVIFMVFFTAITGMTADNNAVVEFGRVAFGGIFIGVIIAAVTIAWVKRVFNDILVEISVIIAVAYLAFFVAEHFMHMSGVLALVALGLAMAGVGKTRISPEVEHFLHEFWELAAFIANVLIFIIVGVVIAQRTEFTTKDFIILGIFYVGVHIIRGIMIILFYPIMKKIGYGLDKKEATVLWYGALRGAIGLALALVVLNVDDKYIDPEIKNQFFFITAGIVSLTLLINATTIKFVVNGLGLTKIAPAKALMIMNAAQYLRTSTENQIERLKKDRFINNADWKSVKEYLPPEPQSEKLQGIEIETIAEMRKRVLEKEKGSYWSQFKEGMLGPSAVQMLSSTIDEILDEGGLVSLSKRKDLELLMNPPKLLSKIQSMPLLGRITKQRFFERLSVSYDIARGFVEAQDEVIKFVESMGRSLDPEDKEGEKYLEQIEKEINENKIEGLTFIRNLRKTYPEIYDAIATRQAIRSLLNYELKTIERLQKNGRIDYGEAHKMIHSVEERMKKLLLAPPKVRVPDAIELIQEIQWLQDLDAATSAKLGDLFQSKIFAVGEKIIKEDTKDDGFYIITRGTVKVSVKDDLIDILGQGKVIGEISVLTGVKRTATVTVESPVTALWLSEANFKIISQETDALENNLWKFVGMRLAENILRLIEPYNKLRHKDFYKWLKKGEIINVDNVQNINTENKAAILIKGKAVAGNKQYSAPALIDADKIELNANSKIFVCTKPETL